MRTVFAMEARYDGKPSQPRGWVKRVTGVDQFGRILREPVTPNRDYVDANRCGSRGIMLYYFLQPGAYEVQEVTGWNQRRLYFVLAADGDYHEATTAEIRQWLQTSKNLSALTS